MGSRISSVQEKKDVCARCEPYLIRVPTCESDRACPADNAAVA